MNLRDESARSEFVMYGHEESNQGMCIQFHTHISICGDKIVAQTVLKLKQQPLMPVALKEHGIPDFLQSHHSI